MKIINFSNRPGLAIAVLFLSGAMSFPVNADHKPNHKGGGGGAPGGGGGGKSKISIEKTLLSESGIFDNAVEAGETLIYRLRLTSTSKKSSTVDVTEMIPVGTTYAGTGNDDFDGTCSGATCTAVGVSVGPRGDPPTDLVFTLQANDPLTVDGVTNTVAVTGVDCNSSGNICTVATDKKDLRSVYRHLINRTSFGITPDQLDVINNGSFDSATYLTAQLFPPIGICTEPDEAHGASVDPASPYGKILPNGVGQPPSTSSQSLVQLQSYSILMAAYNECQLREVLAHFWSNHFSTQWSQVRSKYMAASGEADGNVAGRQATAWELGETDAFRVNALGNFRDLIEISMQSPAMLYYLDNAISVAGSPNENHPRELMELNTMSVTGGYTQSDVEEVAIAMTGWTVDLTSKNFSCDTGTHDFSLVTLDLGPLDGVGSEVSPGDPADLSPANCETSGQYVIDRLFNHPSTATYTCEKLAFVLASEEVGTTGYDNAVGACTTAYNNGLNSTTQIAEMVQAILITSDFTQAGNYLDKVKTPIEHAVAYMRNFEISDAGDLDDMPSETAQMSMNLFQWHHPDGFPEESEYWINSSLIVERFQFITDMVYNTSATNDIFIDPLAFFNGKLKFSDVEIVDYIMDLALANQHTDLERQEALNVLNDTTLFSVDDASTQRLKLRTMLALVLNYPGYQYK